MFRIGTVCSHAFCSRCISKHVKTKVQEKVATIKCPVPKCEGVLEIDSCTPILPENVLSKWQETLCEAVIPDSQKFHCPFENCSALLIKEEGQLIRECKCPYCHRLFCAECSVKWHAGKSCEEYRSSEEDHLLTKLAKEMEWQRCPKCQILVERTQGCAHMTCSCRCQFCYGCGKEWTRSHGGCARK